jgi:zinc/manganese transport system substrate-binding protein
MIMILILVHREGPRIRLLAAVGAVAALALAACGSGGDDGSTTVAATTGINADIVEAIAGPDAGVEQIVPDGASPHDFELSAEDRRRLEEADLVVANGAGLEAGIPLDDLDSTTWELTQHVGDLRRPLDVEGGEEEAAEGSDPHVWMDPTRVAAAVPSLADALADADPGHAAGYRRRADRYSKRLRSLDRELAHTLHRVPPRDRELVTSHDALGYFADRYGFDVVATAFPSTGPEAEASAARLADVEDAVRESEVPTVFAQETDDPEALQLVAEQTGVEVESGLLVESPGPAGSYEEMLRRDAALVTRSLGG